MSHRRFLIAASSTIVAAHVLTSSQKKKQILEATPEEMIAQLESARADLVSKKNGLEMKITAFVERRRSEQGEAHKK